MEQNQMQIEQISEEELQLYKNTQYNCEHPNSWIWNEEKICWVSPKEYPQDGFPYIWDEEQLDWIPFPDYPRN